MPLTPTLSPDPSNAIDDAVMVYEDAGVDDFGFIIDLCKANKEGSHHEYSIKDNFQRCIHCGEESAL